MYDTLIKDELYVLKYAYTWREQSIDLDPLLYLKAFQNIYRCTNVTKLRDFQYRLLLNKLVFNKDFVSWGRMDDELCNFCGCNTETFTHVYSECSIVCKIFKDLKDVFHKNGIEISIGITDIILNRFHENPMHVANLIGLVCKQYIYQCRCKNTSPSNARYTVENFFQRELFTAKIENKLSKFVLKWKDFKPELAKDNAHKEYIESYINRL